MLALAEQLEVPCLIDFIGRYDDAERIARDLPGVTILVAHLGKYRCDSDALIDRFISLAEQYKNLHLDISGVTLPWTIGEAVRRVGPERVVFGIDGPHPYPTQEEFAKAEIAKVMALGLTDAELSHIMHGNITQLLKV